jgi:hypothetical protein
MKILYKECEPELAKDKTLPRDSYLVSYFDDETLKYDISRGSRTELFDHYYDTYGKVSSISWTSGTVSPKLYDYTPKESKKKK